MQLLPLAVAVTPSIQLCICSHHHEAHPLPSQIDFDPSAGTDTNETPLHETTFEEA